MWKLAVTLGVLATPSVALAQAQSRAEILILGTFHMANPGHDINNMKADDVLAPKRQQEMAQLLDVLKRFRPTKIAVESNMGTPHVAQQYADYLAGKYTLTRNEIDQVGYRLAKELGHATVYSVDADGDFPWTRVVNYAKANGRSASFDSVNARWAELTKELGDELQSHSILETMQYLNADARVAQDMAPYFALVRFGEPWEYAGPDLVASWYQRNIRIYRNIVSLIDSPNERILVVFGAGHLGWLRQDIQSDPTVQLRKLSEFTTAK